MIERLLQLIATKTICDVSTFDHFESHIQDRYMPAFEEPWMESHKALYSIEIAPADLLQVDGLRESAFKAAFSHTQDPELSALVSDDFDLIGRALLVPQRLPWTNGLWMQYKCQQFPSGAIAEKNEDLATLIE